MPFDTEECNCPKCGEECCRDSVDVGVGVIYGPWGCYSCGWSSDPEYDSSNGTSPAQKRHGDKKYADPCGGIHSVDRIAENLERLGIPKEHTESVFKHGDADVVCDPANQSDQEPG